MKDTGTVTFRLCNSVVFFTLYHLINSMKKFNVFRLLIHYYISISGTRHPLSNNLGCDSSQWMTKSHSGARRICHLHLKYVLMNVTVYDCKPIERVCHRLFQLTPFIDEDCCETAIVGFRLKSWF